MPRDNSTEALAYAGLGYAVFPLHTPTAESPCDCRNPSCDSPAKHPRTMNGLTDATTDPETVRRWWGTWPAANIGIATGPVSGIVVLDVDPRDGGDQEIVALTGEHGLIPHGPACETGGGGWHYYFKHPGYRVVSRKLAGQKGIDVKGDGGYVVAPPSVHATGAPYAWYDDAGIESPLPKIPGWLLGLMKAAPETPQSNEVPEVIGTGSRNATLASLGGTMRKRGMSQRAIFAALLATNADQCVPPLTENEVAKIAASVTRYEPTPEVPVIVDIGTRRKETRREPYVPSTFTAAELMAESLPDVRWAVPDLLPEGLAILAGKPKLGKSWLSFNVGIAVAEGGVVMGAFPVEDGDVLILALEDNKRRLQSRLKKMLAGEPAPERLHMETAWPREDEGGVEALSVWLGLHPETRFVVIDTLAKFRPRGVDAKYSDDYAAIEGLQQLAGRHGIAILLITHYRKAFSDDWLDNVTGTLGIAGAADTILGLERPRGATGMSEAVLHITGRDVEEKDYGLQWDALIAQWRVLGDAATVRMSREMAETVGAVNRDGGVHTPAQWAPILGKKRNTALVALRRAVEAGHIRDYGSGLYGKLFTPDGDSGDSGDFGPVTAQLLSDSADMTTLVTAKRNENEANTTNPVTAVTSHLVTVEPPGDSGDSILQNGHIPAPEGPCPGCGEKNWSLRVGGRWLCDGCEPAWRVVR